MNSASIQTSGATYDVGGNVLTSANEDGNSTTYTYNGGSGYFAFPIAIKNALKQVSGLAWGFRDGLGFPGVSGTVTAMHKLRETPRHVCVLCGRQHDQHGGYGHRAEHLLGLRCRGPARSEIDSGGSWTLYIHDAFGQLAASYNNNGVTPDCTTCYLTYDMVGTPRLITDQGENVVARHDFIPFGEEIQNGVALRNGNFGFTSNVTQAFTAQESDGGTVQLDYFNARHLSAVLGGFVQPDPGSAGADITSPQSWNAYAYVLGNPLGLVDPSGNCSIKGWILCRD